MPSEQPAAERLLSDSVVESILNLRVQYDIPGLGMVVVAGPSKITGRTTWGEQIITDGTATASGKPYSPDTIFSMASCSKAFAFICAGMLIDRQTIVPATNEPLSWHTKLKDVLGDGWKLQDEYATDHTALIDMAGGRSGFPSHVFSKCREYPDQVIHRMRFLRQSCEFRQRFQYTNENASVMCCVVTALTQQPYTQFLHENVLEPMGLKSTFNGISSVRHSGRLDDGFIRTGVAPGQAAPGSLGIPRPIGWYTDGDDDGDWSQGGGGMVTDMRDAGRILREYLDPRILPLSFTTARHSPISFFSPPAMPLDYFFAPGSRHLGYGYGQMHTVYRGLECLFAPGLQFGRTCMEFILPDAGIGFWITINVEGLGSHIMTQAVSLVFDHLLGLEPAGNLKVAYPVVLPPPILALLETTAPGTPFEAIESVLLNPQGFFDTGYGPLSFQRLDMFDNSPLPKAIQNGALRFPAHARLAHPSPQDRCYITDLSSWFASKLVFISTSDVNVFQWVPLKVFSVIGEQDELVMRMQGTGRAVVTERGIGMFDGWFAGAPPRNVPQEWGGRWEVIHTRCEAWFSRL